MLPVDVARSEWMCTLETVSFSPSALSKIALRLGLRYVRGLREEGAQALVRERARAPFTSIHDLTRRVPELRKDELTTLAEIGALNKLGNPLRRQGDQLPIANCQLPIAPTPRGSGPKLAIGNGSRKSLPSSRRALAGGTRRARLRASTRKFARTRFPSPLQPMNHEERLVADFHGTGLTVGPHPMACRREWSMPWAFAAPASSTISKRQAASHRRLRHRAPASRTAKGFVFLSLEDETGVANAIIAPNLFHSNRLLLASERFLAIEGILQNQDNVISVKAERVLPLFVSKAETVSHDFH